MAKTGTPLILVVEDEVAQQQVLLYNLKTEGYDTISAYDGAEALLLIREQLPDLIILDWMLPEVSGLEICRQIKGQVDTQDIPVIMLSARGEEDERVRGLNAGADDFVAKPYSMSELMARVAANLRKRRIAVDGAVLAYEDLRLDSAKHRVFRGDVEVDLGPTEFRLLAVLLEKPGVVWSRERLLDKVWGTDVYVETRTVDVHIGRLRKALRAQGGTDLIRTVRGAGYALG